MHSKHVNNNKILLGNNHKGYLILKSAYVTFWYPSRPSQPVSNKKKLTFSIRVVYVHCRTQTTEFGRNDWKYKKSWTVIGLTNVKCVCRNMPLYLWKTTAPIPQFHLIKGFYFPSILYHLEALSASVPPVVPTFVISVMSEPSSTLVAPPAELSETRYGSRV